MDTSVKEYLESGNTFFWGAIEDCKLLGYYWGYVSEFLGVKRWHTRSNYICEEARGKGLGQKSYEDALIKAKGIGCKEAASMYAAFNKSAAHIYEKLGYDILRIEVIKQL